MSVLLIQCANLNLTNLNHVPSNLNCIGIRGKASDDRLGNVALLRGRKRIWRYPGKSVATTTSGAQTFVNTTTVTSS